ncbi:MAG: hypothetical protein GF383_05835 [Candidatus Lokiarchaeota archaeon]|nr:hypothetical protein [Candidatus Lokiarchaeota archaeon]MBD3339452.1 hypothetical protein [Candidatus Lokiarchaeota archaeon]
MSEEFQDISEQQVIPSDEKLKKELEEFTLDFTTSSSISRVSIKFLAIYVPIFWFSGIFVGLCWWGYYFHINNWIIAMLLLPFMFLFSYFIFIFACAIFSKLILTLINLIHKPKEGIFKAEKGDKDFEFWCLRTELKKMIIWLMNNCPLPWIDTLAFRWFGVQIDFSSHLYDAWVDMEFIKFGRKVTIGQGAVVMSSMVVGKYLIIKRLFFDDYSVIGGVSTISPGTVVGKDSVIGALSSTGFNQELDRGWIYFGIPVIKLKPNKYAESRRDIIVRKNVDDEQKYEETHEINIDEDKKDIV